MSFDPEAHLSSLEPIGWKLGLERMDALCDELGRPQDSFATIHVVGTNGKSSVARMAAALLTAHGVRAGCLVSPHISRWSERVLVDGDELAQDRFADSVHRTAAAAERVNAALEPGDAVTQFELAVAAGFLGLAEAEVEAAAIEAGLGGRLDATNTLRSSVTALTSIGLDHTEWLGETELEIAGEKLAVLRAGTTLVVGSLPPEVERLARDTARERGCRLVDAGTIADGAPTPAVRGRFQRANFAVAKAAVESLLDAHPGLSPGTLTAGEVAGAASGVRVPGRLELVSGDPVTFVDVAHNRQGAAALAASLPEEAAGSPVFALIAILSDKDAEGILTELAPVLEQAVFTGLPPESLAGAGRPGASTRQPDRLREIARLHGLDGEIAAVAADGLERVRSLAKAGDGVVLVAGSHFLVAELRDFWQ
jgi:dihydrofolate synthase/folylpolyglutamate synthase